MNSHLTLAAVRSRQQDFHRAAEVARLTSEPSVAHPSVLARRFRAIPAARLKLRRALVGTPSSRPAAVD